MNESGASSIISVLVIIAVSVSFGYTVYYHTPATEIPSQHYVSLTPETTQHEFTVKIIKQVNTDRLILDNGLEQKEVDATAGNRVSFTKYDKEITVTGITDNRANYYVTSYQPDISILGCQKYDSADNIPSVDVIHQGGQRVLYNVAKGKSTNSVSNSLGEFEVDYTDSFDTTGVNVTHTYVDTDGDCQVELELPIQKVVADKTEFVIHFENEFSGSGYKADQDDKFFFYYEGVSFVG
jgi:hypothetical protein